MKETPYTYYSNKLGVKIKFLISESDKKHKNSLSLISYKALNKRFKSNTCHEKQLRRASLGQDALILFSSLSRDWKDAITTTFGEPEKEAKKEWFAEHYRADREAFNFYVAYRYGEHNEKRLDEKLIELYTYNASVLNTVLLMKTNRKAYAKSRGVSRLDIWDSLNKDVNAFKEVPHNLPTTKGGLRRKVGDYQKKGYLALVSGKLQNSNANKVFKKEQMALLDELINKHTNLDNEIIATFYNVVADQMNWKIITSGTVANRKKKMNLVAYTARNGGKALSNNLLMQVKRKAPSAPMLYWSVDGWDVELLYQRTITDKDGYSKTTYHNRLTLLVILDPFNKYPIGYAIGSHETPKLIKKALQNAINHTKELFGSFYKPYQLQTDNYSIKKLTPLYEACTKHFTPAKVGNAKSKVVEPYFGYLNRKYCKLLNNWSGHNVDSGSKSQPNDEVLNKIRTSFPDELGCIKQIESIIATERATKVNDFVKQWGEAKEKFKTAMTLEDYLYTFGSETGYTNKLTGEGLVVTIEGVKHYYDCFDVNFRKHAIEDWTVLYDTHNLNQALAVSKDKNLSFLLEEKYIQPMALADRVYTDGLELQRVREYNAGIVDYITDTRSNNRETLDSLFNNNPSLNDTLTKHVLTDSTGQHKNLKNSKRKIAAKAKTIEVKASKKEALTETQKFKEQQQAYYESKINLDEYLS